MSNITQKIAAWALAHVGQKVGNGECWTLAEQALSHSGAKTSADLGPIGADADYVWGDRINIKDVVAGDILQFKNYDMNTTTDITYKMPDGTVEDGGESSSYLISVVCQQCRIW